MRFRYFLFLVAAVTGTPPVAMAANAPDPGKLAAAIDGRLRAVWQKAGIRPAAPADEDAFLRRASLDLVGRIPTVAEVRDFLTDKTPDKRAKLILRLIDSGGHSRHMATFWRRAWVPQADTAQFARLADEFEAWLAVRLEDNTPYDLLARELLLVRVSSDIRAVVARPGVVTPASFFAAGENKPENLAANFTRAFLGINLDCAQCHNHPFARWTRDQFWQTAAFFAPPRMDKGGAAVLPRLAIPNTKRAVTAQLIDGSSFQWPQAIAADTGRGLLAGWATRKDNPYFARNAVNRLWAQLFGTGLIEPLNGLGTDSDDNSPHLDLLKELADAFVANGYDLKYLTRALVLSKAYQLSATPPKGEPADPWLFAKMPVRGLTGEQLYDSLRTAAGLPPERDDTGRGLGLEARKRFAAQFYIERPVAAERSIVQSLSMMNGRLTADLTNPAKTPMLASVADAPFLDISDKVETLFVAALGRKPTAKEAVVMVKHVKGSMENDSRRALADVFWILINSTEFNTNH